VETLLPTKTVLSSATPTSASKPAETFTPIPAATATPTVDLTSISSITADRVGEEVTVQGRVVDSASFSHGFKFMLDDGQGRIVLLMWHDVYDDCWDRTRINRGASVRASGKVSQYEGQLQIEPRVGGDVKAIQPAVAEAPLRAIGSISAEDEGERVMIEGEVVRTEGLSSAVKVFVKDTEPGVEGEILIFIWRNVLDRVADNTGLGTAGSRVRVVGHVEVYRSNLEIVPALPNDVMVLEIP
jgi:DNA/RNA endonuclease YhcR with UshA esterase domain